MSRVMSQNAVKRVVGGVTRNSFKGSRGLTPLAHLAYGKQLRVKQNGMRNVLLRLTSLLKDVNSSVKPDEQGMPCELEDIAASPMHEGYRTMDDFSIWPGRDGNPKTVGYVIGKVKASESRVVCVPAGEFTIIKDSHKTMAGKFQDFLRSRSPLEVCLNFNEGGNWRRFGVRSNDFDEMMAIPILHPQKLTPQQLEDEKKRLIDYFTPIAESISLKSLYFQACPGVRCTHAKAPFQLLLGDDHLNENINGIKVRISPEPFLQVNKGACEILYQRIIEEIEPNRNMTVLDMCCGSGVLALQLSPLVKEVIGIDSCEQSIKDAIINGQVNGSTNCKFIHGTLEKEMLKTCEDLYSDEVVMVVNPGSTGLASGLVSVIRALSNVSKLIYVSCKPEGQALKNFVHLCLPFRPKDEIHGDPFIPVKAIPVDLFPQTNRCELIVTFNRY